jgi:hypothetical protein
MWLGRASSMMRIVSGVALLLLGTLAGLAVVEVVPRLFEHLMPSEFRGLERVYAGRAKWREMMVSDAYLGYRPKPRLDIQFPSEGRKIPVRTTNYGLGDIGFRDIGARPPFDAIAVGDSFTFCDDVPAASCWVRQLADLTGLSIATLGVSGYSTLAEERILDRFGRQLHPRLVLSALFANDFKDNLDFDQWQRDGGEDFWTWRARREGRGVVGGWLAAHSMAYRLAEGALRARSDKTFRYKQDGLDMVFRMDRWGVPDEQRAEDRQRGWELMQKALLDMHRDAEAWGAQLVLVLIPAKEEVYWDIVRRQLPDAENLAGEGPLQVVRGFCAANGIFCCDLTPAVQAEARRGRQLYLRVSGHWNDEGNAVAARAVAACLTAQGLAGGTTGTAQAAAGR